MTGSHNLSEAAHTTPSSFWEVLEQYSAQSPNALGQVPTWSQRAVSKWEKDHIGQKEEQERNEDEGLQMYVSSICALTIQGVILRLATSSPESLVEVQNQAPCRPAESESIFQQDH